MTFRFLIDECLTPALVAAAVAEGHAGSTCVRDRGWSGTKDWRLVKLAVAGDYTLVTHNAVDFRGVGRRGDSGFHAKQAIYAGLVCLNATRTMSLARQRDLFDIVLREVRSLTDLVNRALEGTETDDGRVMVDLYDIPAVRSG